MTKIIVATGNENKMKEIRQIIKRDDIQFVSLKDEGLSDVEIVEDGDTFEEFLKCISILNDFNIRKSLVFKRYKLNIISFYYLSYFFHFIFIACGNYNFCHPRFFLLLISLRVFIIPL